MSKITVKFSVNALNGLTSFLRNVKDVQEELKMVCQRPERAYFISTFDILSGEITINECQRPERAYFISTATTEAEIAVVRIMGVNALNGLTSFLRNGQK